MSALVNYSSSEESEGEIKINHKQGTEIEISKTRDDTKRSSLPVPDGIKSLFTDRNREVDSSPQHHNGRIRSFPHEAGNWATLVFAKYDTDEHFRRLQEELFKCLRPLEFQPMDDYHISLSRTVTIRHHWIQDITDTLSGQFAQMEGSYCEVEGIQVLTNDEHTRSFLALSVTSADDTLENYVREVDSCFEEYKLQKYYQPPLFHVSIGWCLGDVTRDVLSKTQQKLDAILQQALQESSDLKHFYIDQLHMKTGNKTFVFQLDTDS